MRPFITATLFCLFLIGNSSFQCNNCRRGDLRLDRNRSWLPLKDLNQLHFSDNNGVSKSFALKVIDTLETASDAECQVDYKVEYIQTTLYLNSSKTDSIYFQLASPAHLHIRATANNRPSLTSGRILDQKVPGRIEHKSNYRVGNKIHAQAILLIYNEGYSDDIDSVIIANNVDIAGFNYLGKRFILQ